MGVIYNEAPELWGAVLAGVPFVDVINTMVDETLPLTPGEWPEWGNPDHRQGRVRLYVELQPLRQCDGQGLSADAGVGGGSMTRA